MEPPKRQTNKTRQATTMAENTKKTVSFTMDNIFTKMEFFLLNKDGKILREFNKRFDKFKREITADRGEKSELKRVYAVELQAKYNYIAKLFDTRNLDESDLLKKLNDPKFDDDFIFFWRAFNGFDVDVLLKKEEIEIFEQCEETEMMQNIYLGVDCTPEKKESNSNSIESVVSRLQKTG
jgi:hypothetical protein